MNDNARAGSAFYESDRDEDMRAFDRLPVTVRRAMCDAALPAAAANPELWEGLREIGARRVAAEIREEWPCGGIMGERIPLDPEDAEWLARANRAAGRLLDGAAHDGMPEGGKHG